MCKPCLRTRVNYLSGLYTGRATPGSRGKFRALKGRNDSGFEDADSVARFAGSESLGDVIPGLRSLRSLTRGYNLPSLRDSLTRASDLSLSLVRSNHED